MNVLERLVYPTLDEARQTIDSARSIENRPESILFGPGGLDSLGLVRFIVMLEERIADETQVALTLASDKAMSRKSSPFRDLQTLADYIDECIKEHHRSDG